MKTKIKTKLKRILSLKNKLIQIMILVIQKKIENISKNNNDGKMMTMGDLMTTLIQLQ